MKSHLLLLLIIVLHQVVFGEFNEDNTAYIYDESLDYRDQIILDGVEAAGVNPINLGNTFAEGGNTFLGSDRARQLNLLLAELLGWCVKSQIQSLTVLFMTFHTHHYLKAVMVLPELPLVLLDMIFQSQILLLNHL